MPLKLCLQAASALPKSPPQESEGGRVLKLILKHWTKQRRKSKWWHREFLHVTTQLICREFFCWNKPSKVNTRWVLIHSESFQWLLIVLYRHKGQSPPTPFVDVLGSSDYSVIVTMTRESFKSSEQRSQCRQSQLRALLEYKLRVQFLDFTRAGDVSLP